MKRRFRVTHPFHPLTSREFELVCSYRRSPGEVLLQFEDETGRLRSIPQAWTDAGEPDPFVSLAAGRSHFRLEDLVQLADLLQQLKRRERDLKSGPEPSCVKKILPRL